MSAASDAASPRTSSRPFRVALPLLVVGAVFLALLFGLRSISRVKTVEQLRPLAVEAAQRVDIDPNVLLALVLRESGGDPSLRSSAGALGLTQLKPAAATDAARRLGEPAPTPQELLDPGTSLRLGAAYLRVLLDRFGGKLDVALAAYWRGPEWIDRQGGAEWVSARLQRPSALTSYVRFILDHSKRLAVRAPDEGER